jgi:hypothetical protein
MGEEERVQVIGGKPEDQRSLGSQRCRRVDNIRMDLAEIEWGGEHWIDLAQYRVQ